MTPDERVARLEVQVENIGKEIKRRASAHHLGHEQHQRALDLASMEVDRRLLGMNEVREQLHQQASTFVSKDSNNVWHEAFDTRMRQVETRNANVDGKIWAGGAIIIIAVTIISGIFRYL